MKIRAWDLNNKCFLDLKDDDKYRLSISIENDICICSLIEKDNDGYEKQLEVDISYFTGQHDLAWHDIYSGDIIESQCGGQIIEIRFGEYQAYCPADKMNMTNMGFYAVSHGYPIMPIGDIQDYGIKIGNIYENPEYKIKEMKEN